MNKAKSEFAHTPTDLCVYVRVCVCVPGLSLSWVTHAISLSCEPHAKPQCQQIPVIPQQPQRRGDRAAAVTQQTGWGGSALDINHCRHPADKPTSTPTPVLPLN